MSSQSLGKGAAAKRERRFGASIAVVLALVGGAAGCAATGTPGASAGAAPAAAIATPGQRASGPVVVRIDPVSGGEGVEAPGLAALAQELQRGMKALATKGNPAPYYIGYEVHDRSEVVVS